MTLLLTEARLVGTDIAREILPRGFMIYIARLKIHSRILFNDRPGHLIIPLGAVDDAQIMIEAKADPPGGTLQFTFRNRRLQHPLLGIFRQQGLRPHRYIIHIDGNR